MKLTDTHCHLDFNKFDEDRDAVIQRALEAGVERILVPALDLESSRAVIQLAGTHPILFAAVGFHPTNLDGWDETTIENLRALTLPHPPSFLTGRRGKLVAIGEIGLDYYWVKEPEKQARQREALKRQLRLAQEANLPVVIHMREENDAWFGQASADLLAILTEWQNELQAQNHPLAKKPGVLHSFNGNLETAQKAIARNFHIGVTGPVTYKNAEEKRQIIRRLPLEKILIETDAPFLTPVPHRGRRNEPSFVTHIADKIAEIHNTTLEQVAKITSDNANRLFGWGG
ncbi:MAG: TatD family hydrolase [Anaerolineales bacterium]|nr:TatD family hydrolase [Anaerolineales bacterium]NUQ86217.1 TatD family hydrolase [Anaerolineales bacterium]